MMHVQIMVLTCLLCCPRSPGEAAEINRGLAATEEL
jgi:hypothetical protein